MDLKFDQRLAIHYRSASQIARVLTEDWVARQGYCPHCGETPLQAFDNNQPVADFYCKRCAEQFELKSKKAKLSLIINDGAYHTMLARITSAHNPNFFFLTYSKEFTVNNFLIIPKHFFTPSIIIKRPPLPTTARRAGWVGCNIDLRKVPESGKVFLVKDQTPIERHLVTTQFKQMRFLHNQSIDARGWTLDVLKCIDRLPHNFTLKQVYAFTDDLQLLHPDNNNVHAKIRQQLQILRDKGVIEFMGRGQYQKILQSIP